MANKTKPQELPNESPATKYTRRPRILVAEDDPEMRRLLVRRLNDSGFDTVECADGWQLLDHLGNPVLAGDPDDFDLIVSDIRMPGVTGMEILEGIHETEWFVPMILVTAFGNEEIHRRARELGAAGMFDKPFDIEELIASIRKILVLDSTRGSNWSPLETFDENMREVPVDVIFSNMPHLDYIANRIRQSASVLMPVRREILYCRALISGPDDNNSGRYHIQIMVTLHNKVFVVRSNLKKMASEDDLFATIPTAFEITNGKIQKYLSRGHLD